MGYWKERSEKAKSLLMGVLEQTRKDGLQTDYSRIRDITENIDTLLGHLSAMFCGDRESLCADNFRNLKEAIRRVPVR